MNQIKEEVALKGRQTIAVGNAHRNKARTKYAALKGRHRDIALSGLMLPEPCHDRALPYPIAGKAFSLTLTVISTLDSHN